MEFVSQLTALICVCYAFTITSAHGQSLPGDHGNNPHLIQPHNNNYNPGGQIDHGPPSTTVCVEIRNSPGNPLTVCGPQIPQLPPHPQYQPQHPLIKDIGNGPQVLPSQQDPVVVNQKGLLFQQPQPLYIQPYFPIPYANPVQFVKYAGPPQPNPVNDDLSMNCRVSGINYQDPLAPNFNNMPFRFIQSPASEMPKPSNDAARSWMMNTDPNSMRTNSYYPSMYNYKRSSFNDPNLQINSSPIYQSAPVANEMSEPSNNPEAMADYNKRLLAELKQQIATIQDMNQSQAQTGIDSKPNTSNTQQNTPLRPQPPIKLNPKTK